jgi:hypothetical protein
MYLPHVYLLECAGQQEKQVVALDAVHAKHKRQDAAFGPPRPPKPGVCGVGWGVGEGMGEGCVPASKIASRHVPKLGGRW